LCFIAREQRQIAFQTGDVIGRELLLGQFAEASHQRQSTLTGAHALLRGLQIGPAGEPLPGEIAPSYSRLGRGLIDMGTGGVSAYPTLAAEVQGQVQSGVGSSLAALIVAGQFEFRVVERLTRRCQPCAGRRELCFGGAVTGMVLPGGQKRRAERRRGHGLGCLGGPCRTCRQAGEQRDGQPRDGASARRTNKVHWKIL
jgi:hypothetical protein